MLLHYCICSCCCCCCSMQHLSLSLWQHLWDLECGYALRKNPQTSTDTHTPTHTISAERTKCASLVCGMDERSFFTRPRLKGRLAFEMIQLENRENSGNSKVIFLHLFPLIFLCFPSFKGRRRRRRRALYLLDHSLHMPIHAADSTRDDTIDVYDENSFSFYFIPSFLRSDVRTVY